MQGPVGLIYRTLYPRDIHFAGDFFSYKKSSDRCIGKAVEEQWHLIVLFTDKLQN
jgi:hypothetical protein